MGEMTIDQFLGHTTKGGGGGGKRFTWKDNQDHQTVVWLHPGAMFFSIWRHPWFRVEISEDRQTREKRRDVWGWRLVCPEEEALLVDQNWRDRETQERIRPPQTCPHCKMIEHVRMMVTRGEISWTAPVFHFKGDVPKNNIVLLAGGLTDMFGRKNLTDAERADLYAVPPQLGGPITGRSGWKQNQKAKCEYVFTIVEDAHPENGARVTIESNLLGQKVQEVIAKSMKELGRENGNPLRRPYAIQWEYNPKDGIEFNKKFDATRLGQLRPSAAVIAALKAPPPKVGRDVVNWATYRSLLERHALVKLPFDRFFESFGQMPAPAEQQPADDYRSDAFVPEVETNGTRVPEPGPSSVDWENGFVEPAPTDEMFGCDDCGAPMGAKDPRCLKCGREYEIVAAKPPEPAPKPLPKRSTVAPPPAAVAYPQGTPPTSSAWDATDGTPIFMADGRIVPIENVVAVDSNVDDDLPF